MKQSLILLLFSCILMFSCKTDKKEAPKTDDTTAEMQAAPGKKYTLTPFDPSASFQDAKINGVSYVNGKFDFDVADGDYKLGAQTSDADQKMCANSGKGQHIHLIIDNQPYAAKYTNSFDYEIADGEHYMLAFLSRSYHESIKSDDAHVAKKVTIKDNSITEAAPIEDPMLFYSRPKGTYAGKAETDKVMLDFYPVNANIGTTHKIIAIINGEEHQIDKWQPYYITGLPLGKNTISLALVNTDGNKLRAPFNPVSRTFTLVGETAER
ncbi:MAG: hypothetical protein P1U56_04345 [Saprospiraceae bacterium]|nr:hypothetical protein [Saprospiraceae bacterium]